MGTAPGFAAISVEIRNVAMTRPAFVTFGVDPTSTTPTNVAADVVAAITSAGSLQSRIDSQATISSVRVSMGTDGTVDMVGISAVSLAGGYSATTLPPNCACLVHKTTARGGRRGRGRLFIPWCISNSMVSENGTIDSTTKGTLQTSMTTFLTALQTNNVPMVVLHDPGQTPPGPPDVVTALTVDPIISTQRRRLGR